MLIKLIKTNVSKKKILPKRKPKSLSEKSEQNNNTIQDKVKSIENKENEVDMGVSAQIEAKDEKALENYYSKRNAEPITKTDVYEEVRTRFQ